VIGANGDVFLKKDIDSILKHTKADFVMIGRGAIGNPWIFSEVKPTNPERIKTFLKYINYADKLNILTFEKAKQQAFNFTKTLNNAKEIRKQIANIQQNSDDRIFRLIELFKKL